MENKREEVTEEFKRIILKEKEIDSTLTKIIQNKIIYQKATIDNLIQKKITKAVDEYWENLSEEDKVRIISKTIKKSLDKYMMTTKQLSKYLKGLEKIPIKIEIIK